MFSNHGYKFEVQNAEDLDEDLGCRVDASALMPPDFFRSAALPCPRLRHIEPFRSELAAAPALETTLFLHLVGLGI